MFFREKGMRNLKGVGCLTQSLFVYCSGSNIKLRDHHLSNCRISVSPYFLEIKSIKNLYCGDLLNGRIELLKLPDRGSISSPTI